MRVRQLVTLASLAAIGAAAWAGATLWSARRAASIATQRVRADSLAGFSVRNLDPANAPIEVLAAGDLTADGAAFDGKLYLAGNGGVSEYLADGSPGRRFRPGVELPPAPVTALAVGVLPNSSGRELLIGTNGEGLIVFDGSRLWQMRPHDAAARKVTALLPTGSGRLLLGTESAGVLAYDGRHLQAFHPSLARLHVTALAGDAADLWVGTLDQGVVHWHAGQVERWGNDTSRQSNGLPDPQVLAIQLAGDLAFVGTPMGVAAFRAGRFDRVLAPGVFANTLLLHGRDLLIGTFDQGVIRVPLETRPVRPAAFARSLTSGPVRLFESGAGPGPATPASTVFALTDSGLHQLSGEGIWSPVVVPPAGPQPGQLTNANISALAVDESGRLWVGYFDRGLDIVDAGHVTHLEDDALFCINRIATDAETRQVAVATANGLAMFDASGRLRQVLRKREGLLADHVTDVRFIRGATLAATIVAATPAGLTFFDAQGPHSVSAFQGLVSNHVYALGADSDSLLAGTLGGLSVLSRGAVTASYTTANSRLKHNWITAIARVGQEWFAGTYGAAVMRLTPAGAWEQFDDLKTAAVINPNAILTTAAHVYAGTLGGGLLVYDRDKGRWRTSGTGLPSMNVTALAASGGALYIGTDNGLVRIAEGAIQ